MADRWFYRLFGEEFGPVELDALRDMMDKGSVGEDDEVRLESSSIWIPAREVNAQATSNASTRNPASVSNGSDPNTSTVSSAQSNDEWFSRANGFELGPFTFDELMEMARQHQLAVDDEVRLGANGKWRRVGSIGRLMAVLPYQAPSQKSSATPAKEIAVTSDKTERPSFDLSDKKPREASNPVATASAASVKAPTESVAEVDLTATYQSAYEQARAQIVQSMLAQAEAAFKRAEDAAKAEVAWASAPNVDPMWYGFMGGAEFGPVPFAQVFALAKNGQLKPTDFVRNGLMGQFFPSSNVAGLYSAVAAIAKATEALNFAKTQAQAAVSMSLTPASPPPQLEVVKVVPQSQVLTSCPAKQEPSRGISRDSSLTSGSNPEISQMVSTSQSIASKPRSNTNIPQMSDASARETTRPSSDGQMATVRSNGMSSNSNSSADTEPVETTSSQSRTPSRPMNSQGMSGSMSMMSTSSSSYSSGSHPSRPVASAPRASRSTSGSSFSISEMLEPLKSSTGLGAIGAIALVLVVMGWRSLPKGYAEERKIFGELKQIVDDIKQKRSSNATDFTDVARKAQVLAHDVAAKVGKKASADQPVRQFLLWAARDRMPNMLNELKKTPVQQSNAELSYIDCLRQAAKLMNIKDDGLPPAPPPPPEDPNLVADNTP